MPISHCPLWLLAIAGLGCTHPHPARTTAPTPYLYRAPSARIVNIPYLLSLPNNYNPTKPNHPLILSLHGSGSSGTDLAKLKLPPALAAAAQSNDCILVAPLCRSKHWFNTDDLDQFLDYLLATYPIDPDRVYLTGLSLGGYAAWDWAERRPDRFAALVPIAGGADPLEADRLKLIPTWAFHGTDDKTVPPSESVRMVDALNHAGGHARLTLYPHTGHNAWTQAYATPELYTWLLAQRRQSATRLEE